MRQTTQPQTTGNNKKAAFKLKSNIKAGPCGLIAARKGRDPDGPAHISSNN